METVRKHILDRIAEHKQVAKSLTQLLDKLPQELQEQEILSGYDAFGGKNFSIRNANDEVRGLGAKIATWLGLKDKVEVGHTGSNPIESTNYYRFDLGDGFSLDVDCKHRPKCETVRVRHMVEETISICGELPEGYERVEEGKDAKAGQ